MKNAIQLIVMFLILALVQEVTAQNSLYRNKKSAHYPFFEINTIFQYNQEEGLQLANANPANQIGFSYGYKHLPTLQRGIIKSVALDQIKLKVSLIYLPALQRTFLNPSTGDSTTISQSGLNLAFNNLEVKLKTKFDRTSIKLGYIGLPYGRAPKISSEYSLFPGLAGSDLKFSKDVGVRVDLPVMENMDLGASLTMGGLLAGPLMNFNFVDDGLATYGVYSPGSYSYNGNWLFSTTLKTPNFFRKDFGVSMAFGKVAGRHNGIKADANLFRIAPFISVKSGEYSVFTNQLSFGFTNYRFAKTTNATLITQYEQLIRGWAGFYIANQLRYQNDRGESSINDRLVAGISLHPMPLLTIRLNVAFKMDLNNPEFTSNNFNSFFQVIYGFGRKL